MSKSSTVRKSEFDGEGRELTSDQLHGMACDCLLAAIEETGITLEQLVKHVGKQRNAVIHKPTNQSTS